MDDGATGVAAAHHISTAQLNGRNGPFCFKSCLGSFKFNGSVLFECGYQSYTLLKWPLKWTHNVFQSNSQIHLRCVQLFNANLWFMKHLAISGFTGSSVWLGSFPSLINTCILFITALQSYVGKYNIMLPTNSHIMYTAHTQTHISADLFPCFLQV